MLLMDGVRYEEWIPQKEVEEFHPLIVEHYKEIFGSSSLFIPGKSLKSLAGYGSKPDGFVVTFGANPRWCIVEIELSSHPAYDHVVNQVGRFINGISNPITQRNLTEAFYQEVTQNRRLKAEIQEEIGLNDIHKCLTDIISEPPVLIVIVERKNNELEEALNSLRYSPIKILEFRTFIREGVGLPVHAHIFEPLHYISSTPKKNEIKKGISVPVVESSDLSGFKFELNVSSESCIKFHLFYPKDKRQMFPGYKIPFTLVTDMGEIQTHISSAPGGTELGDPNAGSYFQENLADWYRKHKELTVGSKVNITILEPMKKYSLEVIGGGRTNQ